MAKKKYKDIVNDATKRDRSDGQTPRGPGQNKEWRSGNPDINTFPGMYVLQLWNDEFLVAIVKYVERPKGNGSHKQITISGESAELEGRNKLPFVSMTQIVRFYGPLPEPDSSKLGVL